MSKNTGGAAFPMLGNIGYNSEWIIEDGMTLRDYFAGKIIAAMIANSRSELGVEHPGNNLNYAAAAFAVADVMIAERVK